MNSYIKIFFEIIVSVFFPSVFYLEIYQNNIFFLYLFLERFKII
jgi:hypothetical protein